MRTIKTLACATLLAPLLAIAGVALANEPANDVQVASLKVKERLQSIERINVTAEKEQLAVEPDSAAVAALLREAEALDENSIQSQSTAH